MFRRQSHGDLVELARICAEQARATKSSDVANELRRMAEEYVNRAAELVRKKPSETQPLL